MFDRLTLKKIRISINIKKYLLVKKTSNKKSKYLKKFFYL